MADDEIGGYDISIDARRFAGAWANAVRVSVDVADLTIDFIRLDPREPRGMVVSRVTLTPRGFRDAMDRMEAAWQTWVWQAGSEGAADDR